MLNKLNYIHIRGSIGIVCNLSQCLSQIQEEAAAPPDGISHVSRKTQTVVCFDRQGYSFLLCRLLFSFLSILLLSLLCLFWMAILLMPVTFLFVSAYICVYVSLCLHVCFFVCVYTSFCAFLYCMCLFVFRRVCV